MFGRKTGPVISQRQVRQAVDTGIARVHTVRFSDGSPGTITEAEGFRQQNSLVFRHLASERLPHIESELQAGAQYIDRLAEFFGKVSLYAFQSTEKFRRERGADELVVAEEIGAAATRHLVKAQHDTMNNVFYNISSGLVASVQHNPSTDYERGKKQAAVNAVTAPSQRLEAMADRLDPQTVFDATFAETVRSADSIHPTKILQAAAQESGTRLVLQNLAAFDASIAAVAIAADLEPMTPQNQEAWAVWS